MTEVNRGQLKKILLVALSSHEDGEIVAAVKALRNRLKKQRRDIHWFADQFDERAGLPPLMPLAIIEWEAQLAFAVEHIWRLSHREQLFVESLYRQCRHNGRYWEPSHKQKGWLEALHRRLKIVVDVGM